MTDVAMCHMWKPELGRVRVHVVRVYVCVWLSPARTILIIRCDSCEGNYGFVDKERGEAEGRELAVILLRANETITHTMERAGWPRPPRPPTRSSLASSLRETGGGGGGWEVVAGRGGGGGVTGGDGQRV